MDYVELFQRHLPPDPQTKPKSDFEYSEHSKKRQSQHHQKHQQHQTDPFHNIARRRPMTMTMTTDDRERDPFRKLLAGAHWNPCGEGEYPEKSCVGWRDGAEKILVGRAFWSSESSFRDTILMEESVIPGNYSRNNRRFYISKDGMAYRAPKYQILCAESGTLAWLPSSNGHLVENAVIGGWSKSGEMLFIGRARINYPDQPSLTLPGKIQPSRGCLSVAWNGQEFIRTSYEILVGVAAGEKMAKDASLTEIVDKSQEEKMEDSGWLLTLCRAGNALIDLTGDIFDGSVSLVQKLVVKIPKFVPMFFMSLIFGLLFLLYRILVWD